MGHLTWLLRRDRPAVMAPPLLSLPLCILPPGSGSPRLVCYCERDSGGDGDRDDFNLYVTDAAELWSTCFSPDSLARLQKARFGLSGAEDIHSRFRAACQQQAVTVSLQEDRALITLSGDTPALAFDLSKVPSPEAAPRLQALTLSLAEHVCNLERRLAAAEETKEEARTCSHSDLSTGLIAKRAISGKPPVWHMTLNLY